MPIVVDEAVGLAGGIHIEADNLSAVVQPQSLGSGAAGIIQRHEDAEVEQPAVVNTGGIDVETASYAGVVDAGGLRSAYSAGNGDHVEDAAYFVVDVGDVRSGVVEAVAVVARRLVEVVLAEQLVEGRAVRG